ncbi:LysM peptidoglycan-binding domain-containing protein [Vibrio hyugaensis]|uniref:LysM peptidoglycan-binding domain-containing protein n=1 Tax=Vibrio hyugaensis TaxID=1534743 RepID=UPI001CA53AA6|nr:LysM peptidoglycan-binding domain-containing protein [Vibrio hyugaensis]
MQLPLSLKLTSSAPLVALSLILLSHPSWAKNDEVSVRAGVGFYNEVGDSGVISENLSSNLVLGAQVPINDSFDVSMDGFFFEDNASNAYVGMTLDYTAQMSDDFDLYARLGTDFTNGEVIPKLGLGVEAKINDSVGLTFETVARDTDRFAEYQFFVGAKYHFFDDGATKLIDTEYEPVSLTKEPPALVGKDMINVKQSKDDSNNNQQVLSQYQVVQGDTLWDISRRLNIDLDKLIESNRDMIPNPDLIYPGTFIKL